MRLGFGANEDLQTLGRFDLLAGQMPVDAFDRTFELALGLGLEGQA